MSNIIWPEGLPVTLKTSGLNVSYNDPVIRTDMDAGPKKARLRYTGATQAVSGSLTLTEAQRLLLEYFYVVTTGFGVLRFNMIHPQTLETNEFRFTEPPKDSGNGDGLIDVSVTLERM